ncbi:MAG: esterase-like activity of phytase family protein [Pseudomonadota bacterium]
MRRVGNFVPRHASRRLRGRSARDYGLAKGRKKVLLYAILALTLVGARSPLAQTVTALPFALHDNPQILADTRVALLGTLDLGPLVRRHESLAELSGLAWDDDEQLLFGVTDRGWMVRLKLDFSDGRLTNATFSGATRLTGEGGRRLTGRASDSEGMVGLRTRNGRAGDSEFIVAFERDNRLQLHDANGRLKRRIEVARPLRDSNAYRSRNKGFEAVMRHPHAGVVPGTEWPLRGADDSYWQWYRADGRSVRVPRLDRPSAGLVAMEALSDGRTVTLERAHSWLGLSLIIEVGLVDAWNGTTEAGGRLEKRTLWRLDSSLGWRVDNFEALTRHRGSRFLMASDDNGSALQTTLLVYFEIRP